MSSVTATILALDEQVKKLTAQLAAAAKERADLDLSTSKQIRDLRFKLEALAKPAIRHPAHFSERDAAWIAMCERHGITVLP